MFPMTGGRRAVLREPHAEAAGTRPEEAAGGDLRWRTHGAPLFRAYAVQDARGEIAGGRSATERALRIVGRDMKYLVYVSPTKLEMFAAQQAGASGFSAGMTLDLGVLKASVERRKVDAVARGRLIDRVEKDLTAQGLVGDVESGRPYLSGRMALIIGELGRRVATPIALWCKSAEREPYRRTWLALIGSYKNLLGVSNPEYLIHCHSATPEIVRWLKEHFDEPVPPKDWWTAELHPRRGAGRPNDAALFLTRAIMRAEGECGVPASEHNFLAKVLLRQEVAGGYGPERVVLASPVYVALD